MEASFKDLNSLMAGFEACKPASDLLDPYSTLSDWLTISLNSPLNGIRFQMDIFISI